MSKKFCPRCGGEMYWQECENCDDGFTSHDCGEDCCCCLNPELNVLCDICLGACGYYMCDCTEDGEHKTATSSAVNAPGGAE